MNIVGVSAMRRGGFVAQVVSSDLGIFEAHTSM
jgi:hypothetical protein